MSNEERYFINPYTDYGKTDNCFIQDLIDVEFWKKWALETGLYCLKRCKPIAAEKYCDGGIYVGNLGLIFTSFKLVKSGYFKDYENDLKKYMIECFNSNESYYSTNYHLTLENSSLMFGKGKPLYHTLKVA